MTRNGRLSSVSKIPRGILKIWDSIMEIPVIPPSINSLGTRKISSATDIIAAPSTIITIRWAIFSLAVLIDPDF
ncbi:hypothetical protein D3C81_2078120 [compost metagenome]